MSSVFREICMNSFMANFPIIQKQAIDLLCISMDWFLYDRDRRYGRVNRKSSLLRVFTSDILYFDISCITEYHIQPKRKNYNQIELSFLTIFKISDNLKKIVLEKCQVLDSKSFHTLSTCFLTIKGMVAEGQF